MFTPSRVNTPYTIIRTNLEWLDFHATTYDLLVVIVERQCLTRQGRPFAIRNYGTIVTQHCVGFLAIRLHTINSNGDIVEIEIHFFFLTSIQMECKGLKRIRL